MRPAVDPAQVTAILGALLTEYAEPLDPDRAHELSARLADLDEVREWFAGHPEVQRLCAAALRRAGGQDNALRVARSARAARRDASTLRRYRWALQGAVEAGLRVDPAVHPDADDVEAWLAGGHVLGAQGRLADAAMWFGRILEAAPEHVEARALRAWTSWLLDVEPGWCREVAELAAAHPGDPLLADLAVAMSERP